MEYSTCSFAWRAEQVARDSRKSDAHIAAQIAAALASSEPPNVAAFVTADALPRAMRALLAMLPNSDKIASVLFLRCHEIVFPVRLARALGIADAEVPDNPELISGIRQNAATCPASAVFVALVEDVPWCEASAVQRTALLLRRILRECRS